MHDVADEVGVQVKLATGAASAKKFTHPERGEMAFSVLVATMAGHDLNHLKQLGKPFPAS